MANVLVVDDDAGMRRILDETLSRAGHTVTLAVDGRQGLRLIQAGAFDLVITDLVMPEFEGMQLLRTLRVSAAPPKVIAMSGGGRGSAGAYLEMAALQGAAATLHKPFTADQLAAAIQLAIGE